MNDQLVTSLISSGVGLLAGLAIGALVFSKSSKVNRIVGAVIVLVTILTFAQGVVIADRQAGCNTEFRRVIAERGNTVTVQNDASRRLQQALIDAGANQVRQNEARKQYIDDLTKADRQRLSNPYPDPRCG